MPSWRSAPLTGQVESAQQDFAVHIADGVYVAHLAGGDGDVTAREADLLFGSGPVVDDKAVGEPPYEEPLHFTPTGWPRSTSQKSYQLWWWSRVGSALSSPNATEPSEWVRARVVNRRIQRRFSSEFLSST